MKIRKKTLPVLRPLGDDKDVDALRKTILKYMNQFDSISNGMFRK